MAAMLSKRVKLICIGVACSIVALVTCLLVLLNTQWVFSRIEHEAESATGYELQLANRAKLNAVLPSVSISVPTAVLRSVDASSALQRVRFDGVQFSVPLGVLLGRPLKRLRVHIDAATAIVVGGADEKNSSHDDLQIDDLEKWLAAQLEGFGTLDLTVSADEIHVIVRELEGLSSRYQVKDNLLSMTRSDMNLSSTLLTKRGDQSIAVHHRFTETEDGLLSDVAFDVSSVPNVTSDTTTDNEGYRLISRQSINGNNVSVETLSASGPNLDVTGQLDIALDDRYGVRGRIDFRQLDFSDIPMVGIPNPSGGSGKSGNTGSPALLFSDQEVDIGQYADVDLSVSFGAVRLNNQPIISGDVLVASSLESTSVSGENLSILGGQGDFKVNAHTLEGGGHKILLDAQIDRAQLSRLQITQDDNLLFSRGEADTKISLQASGHTQQELVRSLTGYLMLASSGVEVSQRYAEMLDRGVITTVINGVDNYRKTFAATSLNNSKGSLPLSCASLKLIVNKGRVEAINGLVVELPDNTLISSGFIDLHTESLGFGFRTKKKKLLDWSALSLIKFVELGGNLSEPRVIPDRSELIKQGLLTSSSVLVGSIPSLVYRLAEVGLQAGTRIQCTPRL